jgi:glutamate dehydrogenase (NAD(P)+)
MIIEGANGPDYPAADDILASRNILVPPDTRNAGGVTVSCFEWVQDFSSFSGTRRKSTPAWSKREGRSLPVSGMSVAQDQKVSLRTATSSWCKRIPAHPRIRGLYLWNWC